MTLPRSVAEVLREHVELESEARVPARPPGRARPEGRTIMNSREPERRQNRRTALVLLSVALVFFLGVIARRWFVGG
jgi:hypothetical protein